MASSTCPTLTFLLDPPMRKLMMFNRVSADGYFAAPDGNLNWVVPDAALDKEGASGTQSTDTILFGRRTYDMFEQFWPNVRDDAPAAPDPHTPGRFTPEMRVFAKMINETTKVVFSRTRKDVTWTNSQLRRELAPAEIEAMKQKPGKDRSWSCSRRSPTRRATSCFATRARASVAPGARYLCFRRAPQFASANCSSPYPPRASTPGASRPGSSPRARATRSRDR